MSSHRLLLVLAGTAATALIAFGSTLAHGPAFVADIDAAAQITRDKAGGAGIALDFTTYRGWLTRHPSLSGGEGLSDEVRTRAAGAVAHTPGVGGVHWQARGARSRAFAQSREMRGGMHCQDDVQAILKARSIRFSDASASIDPASQALLDEVAESLRPCLGGIIAVTGHTNNSGDENANVALSKARADAVRWALIGRGIPADGLRTTGLGSRQPLEGLDPADAANRRIDFSVIEKVPLRPTPIDTPGPG